MRLLARLCTRKRVFVTTRLAEEKRPTYGKIPSLSRAPAVDSRKQVDRQAVWCL